MSSNQKLVDTLTLRQIFIERYSKGEANRLLKHLNKLSKKLKTLIAKDYDRISTVRLIKKIDRLSEQLLKDYGDDLTDGLKKYAQKESEFARQALIAATTATAINLPALSTLNSVLTDSKMRLISGSKVKKLTITQAVYKFTRKHKKEVIQTIRDGVTIGRTSQEVTRDISGLVKGRTRHQAAALVRTTTNHIGNRARQATYEANDDVIIGERFVATLDSRTTITCASLDGDRFDIGQGPIPPVHWGCRSVRVPIVNPEYNLGAGVAGQRASSDGPVSAQTTYGGWLKRQSKDAQNEVLGVERAKLFRSGKLSIDKFADDTGKVYSLKQLERLNPIAFN